MCKTMLIALAVVTILSTGQFTRRAEATVVCGTAGCAPVQVKRVQKHRLPTAMTSHPAS
jgi:hypothetical protein